jgi:hypothetical protein
MRFLKYLLLACLGVFLVSEGAANGDSAWTWAASFVGGWCVGTSVFLAYHAGGSK